LRCKGNDFLGVGQIFCRLFMLFSRARALYNGVGRPTKSISNPIAIAVGLPYLPLF